MASEGELHRIRQEYAIQLRSCSDADAPAIVDAFQEELERLGVTADEGLREHDKLIADMFPSLEQDYQHYLEQNGLGTE